MGRIDPKLNTMLLALLGSQELVAQWWRGPNLAFGCTSPRDMYETNPAFVEAYLLKYYQGEGS